MTMIDKLACGKNSWREFHTVNQCVKAAFQNTNQVLTCITTTANSFLIVFLELLLANVTVIALELLFRHELHTEIRRLAAALAMLTRSVFAGIDRRFSTSPEVYSETAINFMFGIMTFVI